ncbi:MAG: signal peptidase I [Prochlorococcaceae cyanobacterium]|jgi:signal peptidase I
MPASESPSPADPHTPAGAGQPGAAGWWPLLRQLLLWVLVALLLRTFVLEPRWIPSGSMLPTLQLQDRVLVEKLRPHHPAWLPLGSIVVFHPPAGLVAAGYDPDAALIKRIVAGPGDQVEVRDGVLWRNGVPVPNDWAPEPMGYTLPPLTVPPGHHLVLGDNRNASLDSHLWGPLPDGQLIGSAVWRYWPLQRFGALPLSPAAER